MQQDGPGSPHRIAADPPATLRDHAGGIIAFGVVLALLYFGRGVLIPFVLALMLSLLIAPLVRALRGIGLGRITSVLASVLAVAIIFSASAAVLGTQVLRMAASLPQYEKTIQGKLRQLDAMTVGRLNALTREANRLIESHGTSTASDLGVTTERPELSAAERPIPVELHEPQAGPFQILARVLAPVWRPIATTGIVLVVLVFVLLEYEALRDRFILLAGASNIRVTTFALNDASQRLSRFFVSQLTVNCGVGASVALGLGVLGLPHAALWGSLAAVLRFVPYVGVWIAALLATALALAVVPGWSLAAATLGLFIAVELVAGQAVEPNLYGHTTGLSPLSVVVAAIFWSSLWGPIGLILSTPLTLCLFVLGRNIRALSFLELLLADTQPLTLPQKFYQRVLSGDAEELITAGRAFLKHDSFAAYCDLVLIPAMHLAFLDFQAGAISKDQQFRMRNVLLSVVSALGGEKPLRMRRQPRSSVLQDSNPGRLLRLQREHLLGRWQGPLSVPPGSIALCLGLDRDTDLIAAELLVRALREQKLDARHLSIEDLDSGPPPGLNPGSVAIIYLVSAFPSAAREHWEQLAELLRGRLPSARIATVFVPWIAAQASATVRTDKADYAVTSFVEAGLICHEQAHIEIPAPAGN